MSDKTCLKIKLIRHYLPCGEILEVAGLDLPLADAGDLLEDVPLVAAPGVVPLAQLAQEAEPVGVVGLHPGPGVRHGSDV